MRRILPFAILVAAAACTDAPAAEGTHWVRVAQDPNYTIWIDTTRVTASWANAWDVWYRTDHTQARNHKGQPFHREVVNSYLRCADLAFRVVSVDLYTADWKLVAMQRDDSKDVEQQPWRPVVRGSAEEVAARAACHYGDRALARYPGRRTR